MKTLFIDKITFSSLIYITLNRKDIENVWYFEKLNRFFQKLIELLFMLGVIRVKVLQVKFHIGQMRNGNGENHLLQLRDEANAICSKIKKEVLLRLPFLETLNTIWPAEKLVLFFRHLIEPEVRLECMRIGLLDWIIREQLCLSKSQCILLLHDKLWLPYIKAFGKKNGILLESYGFHGWKLTNMEKICFRASVSLFNSLVSILKSKINGFIYWLGFCSFKELKNPLKKNCLGGNNIAIRYWHRKLGFNTIERTEFFWLQNTDIPLTEVLLYDYIGNKSINPKTLEEIKKQGIKLLGHAPGIPVWCSTSLMFKIMVSTLVKIVSSMSYCFFQGKKVQFFFFRSLLALAFDYSYWYDFYAKNKVKVNIGSDNTRVGQILAIDSLQGISANYQMSIGTICLIVSDFCAGEDIEFVFSPLYENLYRSIELPVNKYVHTGYIYDGAIRSIQKSYHVSEDRNELYLNGAKFIICFFDENSSNIWNMPDSNEMALGDYEFLVNWLIQDSSLGMVFKPKNFSRLIHRVERVKSLFDQATATGRCKILSSEYLLGSVYPAEAALMADICIGRLDGGTAAFEAQLAGVKALLIDNRKILSHPFYSWGMSRVIYDDWKELRTAIEHYRACPETFPDFGEWRPEIVEIDPYQDGEAGLRMGSYIQWVYEALKQGKSKEASLSFATEKFKNRWGDGHIAGTILN